MRRWLPLLLLGWLSACEEQHAPASDKITHVAGEPAAAGGQAPVTVELREGTNLSFAVDAAGKQIVLALQGQLFRLPLTPGASAGEALPLFSRFDDAREPAIDDRSGDVVYQSYRSGTWDLWRVPLRGGEPVALTDDDFDDREPHVNGQGDIVFASDREGGYNLWLLRHGDDQRQPVRLTQESGNAHSPAWSPDGTHVAYAVDGSSGLLRVLDFADGEQRTVVSEPGTLSGVAWSADGLHISYQLLSRDDLGVPVTALRRVDFIGGTPVTLSKAGADVFPFRAAWLADGTFLYAVDGLVVRASGDGGRAAPVPFVARVELNREPYRYKRRNHDDTTPRQALGIVSPALSPDGRQIAFSALGDLWLWSPDDRKLHRLTDDEAAEQSPAFFPGGESLLYISDRDGPQKMVVRDLAAGTERMLEVPGATSLTSPVVAPGGGRIAVFRDVAGSPFAGQLILVDVFTGAIRQVGRPMPPQLLSFAPDGSEILTSRLRPYSTRYREGTQELLFLDVQQGTERTVVPRAHRSLLDASLSPDGRSVTFLQEGLLWRIDLDPDGKLAEAPVPVTSELTDQPSFSADGRRLVFSSGSTLKRMELKSGAVEDVTPPLPWSPSIATDRWVLRAGRLYDGRLDGYRSNIDIVIKGQRIETLEPARPDRAERVVDASGKVVIPGLFEMHAHMANTSGRQGRAWLAWGITTVRDPGSQPFVARERKEAWDSGRRPGPRTHVTGYLTDGNRVYYAMAEGITGGPHLDRALARAKALEYDFIKTYVRLPDALQARVIAFAHGEGIPVTSHELFPAAAIGMDHVEHFGGTSRRGYQPRVSALGRSYADVEELLVRSGMGITPTMVLPGFAAIAAEQPDLFETPQFRTFYGESMAALRRGAMPVTAQGAGAIAAANGDLLRRLVQRDALVVTGTDSPFVPYAAGLHAEFRLYARAGLRPSQILHAATWKSAIAARVEHDLGSIEVGKIADLVVIDGDPLATINDADNVVMTVKGGRAYSLQDLGVIPPGQDVAASVDGSAAEPDSMAAGAEFTP